MSVLHLNKENFEEVVNSGKNVLVDFWAPWCGYCRRIGPAYEKIAEQYAQKLIVAKVNIDEVPALADREQIEVIPTLVLYRDGNALDSIVAPDSKAAIEAFIHKNLG